MQGCGYAPVARDYIYSVHANFKCYLPALLLGHPRLWELPATGGGGADGVGLLAGVKLALALGIVFIDIPLATHDIPPVAANELLE